MHALLFRRISSLTEDEVPTTRHTADTRLARRLVDFARVKLKSSSPKLVFDRGISMASRQRRPTSEHMSLNQRVPGQPSFRGQQASLTASFLLRQFPSRHVFVLDRGACRTNSV